MGKSSIASMAPAGQSLDEKDSEALGLYPMTNPRFLAIEGECERNMREWGYAPKRPLLLREGECHTVLGYVQIGTRTIGGKRQKASIFFLSRQLLNASDDQIRNTCYHELCHAYVDGADGRDKHGPKWRKAAKDVGALAHVSITRLAVIKDARIFKDCLHLFRCSKCGQYIGYTKESEFTRHYADRITKGGKNVPRFTCGACGGPFEKIR